LELIQPSTCQSQRVRRSDEVDDRIISGFGKNNQNAKLP
jgi:hypothetical protein